MSEVVSVVVPVFNAAPHLALCIESILCQSYPSVEIVLVDDGSTDDSGKICEYYARQEPQLKVVHQRNAGPATARNVGVGVAKGDYILFVDSDDWVDPSLVSHLREVMAATNADIVVGEFIRTANEQSQPRSAPVEEATVLTSEDAIRALLGPQHVMWTVAVSKLFRRSALAGLDFPAGRLHEDEFFTFRALAQAGLIAHTSAAQYFYRQRPGSIMASQLDLRRGTDAIDAYRERADFLRQHGPADLVGEASAQVFRRQLQLYRVLDEDQHATARRELRREMRGLARELSGMPIGRGFRLFSIAYAWVPWLVEPMYALYTRRTQVRTSMHPESGPALR